jgi:hypothetical protein
MKSAGRPHSFGLGVPHTRRRLLYAAFALAFASGVAWLVFHYWLQQPGEFGPEPHALEIWWLRLHGAAAFVLLWFAGILWGTHARPALKHEADWKRSGLGVLGVLLALAASGYLLYYLVDDTWRDIARIVHWSLGLALAIPLGIHIVGVRRARRRQ